MYVRQLALRDFRSWAHVDLELAPGRTVFVGSNGYGKTNLVEALWYCATLGSHRVATDAAADPGWRGAGGGVGDRRQRGSRVGRRHRDRRRPGQQGAAEQVAGALTREILGAVRAVLFAPEDLALVRGDPGERRRYLDELAAVRRPRVAAIRADYEKVLRQRTALLKSAAGGRFRGDRGVLDTLDVWDGQLAAHGAELMAARIELVNLLAPRSRRPTNCWHRPRGRRRSATAAASSGCRRTARTRSSWRRHCWPALARRRDAELDRGMCLVGPHRDDLELRLGDQPAKGFASHGESWSMALSLRLAAYELLRTEGSEPVLILDDVFAELDTARRRALAGVAATAEQVLVTAAVGEDIPEDWDATRVGIALQDDDNGRMSVVTS